MVPLIWAAAALAAATWAISRGGTWRRVGVVAAVHLAAVPAQLVVATRVYPVSDMARFHAAGATVADAVAADPGAAPGLVARLLLGAPTALDLGLTGGRGSDAMAVLAAALRLVTADSLLAACIVCALLAAAGRCALAVAADRAGAGDLAWAAVLVPSGVYWTSGLAKEALATLGLGLAIAGAEALRTRRWGPAVAGLVAAALCLGLIKPYLLFPAAFGVGVWAAGARWRRGLVAGLLAAVLVALAAELLLDRFAPSHWLEQITVRQALVGHQPAGSSYAIGDPDARSWAGQLPHLPLALVTGLFRPGLWEAHNAFAVLTGLENAVLVGLLAVGTWRRGSRLATFARVALAGVVVVAAVGIGLTTINLGTLSRHRAPILPLLWMLALVTATPSTGSTPAAPARAPP